RVGGRPRRPARAAARCLRRRCARHHGDMSAAERAGGAAARPPSGRCAARCPPDPARRRARFRWFRPAGNPGRPVPAGEPEPLGRPWPVVQERVRGGQVQPAAVAGAESAAPGGPASAAPAAGGRRRGRGGSRAAAGPAGPGSAGRWRSWWRGRAGNPGGGKHRTATYEPWSTSTVRVSELKTHGHGGRSYDRGGRLHTALAGRLLQASGGPLRPRYDGGWGLGRVVSREGARDSSQLTATATATATPTA